MVNTSHVHDYELFIDEARTRNQLCFLYKQRIRCLTVSGKTSMTAYSSKVDIHNFRCTS